MDWSQPCEWEEEGAADWLKTVSLAAQLILFSALWISSFYYPAHHYLDRNNTFFFFFHTVLFQKIWCILPWLCLPGRCFSKVRQKKSDTSDCWKVKCLLKWAANTLKGNSKHVDPMLKSVHGFLLVFGQCMISLAWLPSLPRPSVIWLLTSSLNLAPIHSHQNFEL